MFDSWEYIMNSTKDTTNEDTKNLSYLKIYPELYWGYYYGGHYYFLRIFYAWEYIMNSTDGITTGDTTTEDNTIVD